ncbi:MAG: hypothetical protein KTR22_01485 [Flavobacteriaceae bacterium]|nr:hypothetical protein [Flavobacteriaceae bacterium]
MTKKMLTAVFLLISLWVYPQTGFTCSFEESPLLAPLLNNFDENDLTADDNRPYVFQLHYWQLVRDDGTSDNLLTEQDFLESLAFVNKVYNQFNIFFKWDGLTNVPNTIFYDIEDRDELLTAGFYAYVHQNGFYVPGQLNIYTHNAGGGSSGQSTNDFMPINLNWQLIRHGAIIHEIGHNYGLAHTFGPLWDQDNPFPHNCEHQTRNPGDLGFNANTHGDKLVETYATPYSIDYDDVVLDGDCNYIGSAVDCTGELYINPEFKNFMSYTRSDCYREFKSVQIAKMRFTIREVFLNGLESLRDTIHRKELYEPYQGAYTEYAGQPNGDPPLFQPGFEYYFFECECPEQQPCNVPSAYDDTNFTYTNNALLHILPDEIDYSAITHPNHTAMAIKHPHEAFWPQPRRCFDNWLSPPIIGGTITKFNDGIYNANVTITQKDSLQMNDVNLINDLDPGLYNIKKSKVDGSVEETNLLKENE